MWFKIIKDLVVFYRFFFRVKVEFEDFICIRINMEGILNFVMVLCYNNGMFFSFNLVCCFLDRVNNKLVLQCVRVVVGIVFGVEREVVKVL